jgi:excinuclease ABC subunit C
MSMNVYSKNLAKRISKEVPDRTGVYLFYGPSGELLYIGKSIRLRQRMSSYFQYDTSKLETRLQTMIFNIRRFEWIETNSELGALLLEDQWIKERLPPYNRKQKKFSLCKSLGLTNDPFPALILIDPLEKERYSDCRLYGPYPDAYFADRLLEITCKHLHLRACQDPIPFKKCAQFDIGLCKGPCRDMISYDDYRSIVDRVSLFLDGEDEAVIQELNKTMKNKALRLDFEGASSIRDLIQFIDRYCKRQAFIRRFKTEDLIIHEYGEKGVTHLFSKGRYKMKRQALPSRKADTVLSGMDEEAILQPDDERFLLDSANLVHSWLKRHEDNCAYEFKS